MWALRQCANTFAEIFEQSLLVYGLSIIGQYDTIQMAQLERAGNWRTSLGVVFSIGLRPCSGAILVLVFARAVDLPLAGVAAVAAMSMGTAATVVMLATAAVYAEVLEARRR